MTNSISVHLYKFTRIQHAISVQIFSYKFEKKLYSYVCKWKTFSRVQAVQERLRVDKDNARFEIAALFELPVRREKKRANFKTCIDVVYPESFLYWLYCISRKFLGFQGVRCNMILLYFLWICFESKSVKRSTRRWKIVSKEVLISIINELQLYFSILN